LNLAESKIHFIGIGGIGMSGIAEVLVNMGCRVSGSDLSSNAQVERLRAMGVSVALGHGAKNLPSACDAVVYSSAVKASNPEIVVAKKRKIPIIQRAEMLSELMRLKRGIAIGGTHGKTTTTSMTATVLLAAKVDPTIVIGGRLDLLKSTAALGKGQWLIAEADESDGSFLRLSPEIAVITNIDNDHMDHYRDFDDLKRTFAEFARKVPFYGCGIFCVDDKPVSELARRFEKRHMTYGFSKTARLQATTPIAGEAGQRFVVRLDGKDLGQVELQVPGKHNVLNALAAIAVALELKIDFPVIAQGLAEYRGVDRRLQKKGQINGALVIDDYGHHPTEVLATLSALRQAYPKRRIVVAFQPHRYSRTQDCWDQFTKCFKAADVIGILDVYPAGEKRLPKIDSTRLVKAISKKHKNVFYWGNIDSAAEHALKAIQANDIFLTLGAGDIWKVGQKLLSGED
jgi:UDP-N-acetylmuramate--alanine ligase